MSLLFARSFPNENPPIEDLETSINKFFARPVILSDDQQFAYMMFMRTYANDRVYSIEVLFPGKPSIDYLNEEDKWKLINMFVIAIRWIDQNKQLRDLGRMVLKLHKINKEYKDAKEEYILSRNFAVRQGNAFQPNIQNWEIVERWIEENPETSEAKKLKTAFENLKDALNEFKYIIETDFGLEIVVLDYEGNEKLFREEDNRGTLKLDKSKKKVVLYMQKGYENEVEELVHELDSWFVLTNGLKDAKPATPEDLETKKAELADNLHYIIDAIMMSDTSEVFGTAA